MFNRSKGEHTRTYILERKSIWRKFWSVLSHCFKYSFSSLWIKSRRKSHSDSNDTEQVSQDTPSNENKQPEQKAGKSYSKDHNKLVDVSLDRAVDGDTIKISYNGNVDTVRYLLVDTPETKNQIHVFNHMVKMHLNETRNWLVAVSCNWVWQRWPQR